VSSGTVRSSLDPFNEFGGDTYLWEAVRDCGLCEAVRGMGGGGLKSGRAGRRGRFSGTARAGRGALGLRAAALGAFVRAHTPAPASTAQIPPTAPSRCLQAPAPRTPRNCVRPLLAAWASQSHQCVYSNDIGGRGNRGPGLARHARGGAGGEGGSEGKAVRSGRGARARARPAGAPRGRGKTEGAPRVQGEGAQEGVPACAAGPRVGEGGRAPRAPVVYSKEEGGSGWVALGWQGPARSALPLAAPSPMQQAGMRAGAAGVAWGRFGKRAGREQRHGAAPSRAQPPRDGRAGGAAGSGAGRETHTQARGKGPAVGKGDALAREWGIQAGRYTMGGLWWGA
jgi:hypothetical protein